MRWVGEGQRAEVRCARRGVARRGGPERCMAVVLSSASAGYSSGAAGLLDAFLSSAERMYVVSFMSYLNRKRAINYPLPRPHAPSTKII